MSTQFFLINHTLSDICITQNNILQDITVYLSEAIIKNFWSYTDKIEVYCCRDDDKSYIRNLINTHMYNIDYPTLFLNEAELTEYMYEVSDDDNYDF
jgi:hypothetical protein